MDIDFDKKERRSNIVLITIFCIIVVVFLGTLLGAFTYTMFGIRKILQTQIDFLDENEGLFENQSVPKITLTDEDGNKTTYTYTVD